MSIATKPRLGERFAPVGDWRALTSEQKPTCLDVSAHDLDTLILHEAALLDRSELLAWLDLFTDDASYWMPLKFNDGELRGAISLVYDSKRLMEDRVNRLLSGTVPSQDPLSRSVRILGARTYAPAVESDQGERQCLVEVPFTLFEQRGDLSRQYAGWFRHLVRNAGGTLRLVGKRVQLINSDRALPNLTFIP